MQPQLSTEQRAKAESFGRQHLTGLVTLLFTDMVDSTALKQGLGRQSFEFFEKHHQLIRDCLARFPQSQEIEVAGDSFFLLFAVPSDAVEFALILQSKLRTLFQGTGLAVQDRIGINLGEVVIREPAAEHQRRGLFGLQVDTCARVMSLAKGGQILMTRQVFDSARRVLKDEAIEGLGRLSWVSHGYYQLKGVEEPVEVYEAAEMGHGLLTAPAASEKARRFEAMEAEPVLGWRPAMGQVVPNTQWVLEQHLGFGGFGEVWLGRHQKLKEQRVFKFCFRADRVRSLKREVTLFRLLKERIGGHPNIVGVQEVFFQEPPYYLMMEYAAGQDLVKWCAELGGLERAPLAAKLEIVAQVADALQAAHDAGIIHRDVKPANILVSEGPKPEVGGLKPEVGQPSGFGSRTSDLGPLAVKLTDFGIGQVLSEEYLAGITRAGFTETMVADTSSSKTGTQLYMAPELLSGKPASTRSDIYSLGVVLYQMLAGDFTRPLTTDWESNISDPLLREDLRLCFAGNPNERFAGAGQLALNLRKYEQRETEFLRQQAEQAERDRLRQQIARRYRLGMAFSGVILVMVAIILALGYGLHKANIERERLRLHSYVSDIRAADAALKGDDLGQAVDLLRRHIPTEPSQSDLRGLEWRYLWQQSRSDESDCFLHTNGFVTCMDISADGRFLATSCQDGKVRLWSTTNHSILLVIEAVETLPPDGQVLV